MDGDPPGAAHPSTDPRDTRPATRLIARRPTGSEDPGIRWLSAGERAEFGGVRVAALPAGTADGDTDPDRVVLVLGDGLRTLLWAAGSGPLPPVTLDALDGAGLSAAVLDAGAPAAGTTAPEGAPSGLGLAHQVARLRAIRALAQDARLVAAGLPHTGPTPQRFGDLAASWGVQVLPDGGSLWADPACGGSPTAPARPLPVRTVVLGAAGSGKSLAAESLLAASPEVVYAATGPVPDAGDAAWADRVAAHRRRRPPWWHTVEGTELAPLLRRPGPPLLVDSLGTWLTAQLSDVGCWDDRPGWRQRLDGRVSGLVTAWRQAARTVVAVAEEVGWGVVPATESGGRFRDALGQLNRRICDQSEQVLLLVAGRMVNLDAGTHPLRDERG